MASKYKLEKVLTSSGRIIRVWTENPTFTLGEITLAGVQAKVAGGQTKQGELEDLKMRMTALSNEINAIAAELAGINTRALSGFRAVFGPNSTQYEQAGGTPTNERKHSSKKPTKPKA